MSFLLKNLSLFDQDHDTQTSAEYIFLTLDKEVFAILLKGFWLLKNLNYSIQYENLRK